MARRKTLDIRTLVEKVNKMNAESTCDPLIRQGCNSLLEAVLHEANVYAGYWALRPSQVPAGQAPGIIFDDGPDRNHVYPDETRKMFFLHSSLRD